jgi:very-short-patch-repair endonuclease
MSEAAAAAIERLREKLIDLSSSNRLLNFRHGAGVSGSQSVLRFVGKSPDQLFSRLQDQKTFIIEPVPAPSDREIREFYHEGGALPGLESEDERNRVRPDAPRWARYLGWDVAYELPLDADASDTDGHRANGRVQALLYPEQLDTRLRRLRSNARLAIEESGSNMLFLVFGFLEWSEKSLGTRGDDRRIYQAPLLLMPASIETVTNARGVRSFTISWNGEDLQPNLSLKRKLAVDFGIDLPESGEDELPDVYFNRARNAIAKQNSWRIRRFVTLTLFTNLGKLLLYLDLDPAKWPEHGKPANHLIVRSLLGDGIQHHSDVGIMPDARAIAKTVDLDLPLVDRADETQARALLRALSGENLVVQGPPGTGKSQTITNLIAAALDSGKTVLFVAEKLAALEVVRRRLREVGLGDFCLELHSHKTRKKTFFEDLNARLSKSSGGTPAELENALAALTARRTELDTYAAAAGRLAGRTGLTVADLLFETGRVRAIDAALTRKVDESRLPERIGSLTDTLSITKFSDDDVIRALGQTTAAARSLAAFGGPKSCPWRGVEAQSLAIDPRAGHQILSDWRDNARDASKAIAKLNGVGGLSLPARLSMVEELRKLADCTLDLPTLFSLTVEVQTIFEGLSRDFGLPLSSRLHDLLQIARLLNLLASAPYEALAYGHEGLDSPEAAAALDRLSNALKRREDLVIAMRGRIERPEADNLDEQRLRAAGKLLNEAGIFSRFSSGWREARRLARAHARLGASKKAKDQGVALLMLAERVAIDLDLENDVEIQAACGAHFRGAATDVVNLVAAVRWRKAVRTEFGDRRGRGICEMLLRARYHDVVDVKDRASRPVAKLTAQISEILDGGKCHPQTDLWVAIASSVASSTVADALANRTSASGVADFMRLVTDAASAGKAWEEAQRAALDRLAIDPADWFGTADEVTAQEIAARAESALQASEALAPWLAYARSRREARKHHVTPLLEAMENGLIESEDLEKAWRIAWLTDAARKVHALEPILNRFGGLELDGIRREYARLDSTVMDFRRRAISSRLMLRRPPEGIRSPRVKEMTELTLLARCIAMQTRHPSIRHVTARAGAALQALKPCFMMGPLSVAQYLAPGALNFDLVIMDEASQIRPEDAIGAVARGGQLVVVGDDKQLPPTSFFERLSADVDAEDDPDAQGGFVGEDDESVIALANGSLRGEQGMLRWHYRSRHPELIAFSNHQFYNDELVVFPAPRESDRNFGMTRIFVEDGCSVDGINDAEARRVAQAAVDHLRSRPSQSLMVVAMNTHQKERIETHIAKLEAANGGLGAILDESEAEARIEPFVVKNLENVQGDERDVVMISMTYGPRERGGKVPQTFGPINQSKGHRRLNVLFTRAKEQMVVFTSLRSSDIQAGPESNPGPRALQGFLRFAETKQLPSGARLTGKSPESPFEEAVARELERAGYGVEPQLGVGSYRIDIAVRNPDAPDQFLLGVECDGAMYHSTLSARDRDRLRQEVLENLGWAIERIWSVDWFRDPARELKRVLDRLGELRGPPPNIDAEAEESAAGVFEETTKPAEDLAAPSEGKPRAIRQTDGLPRQLKEAFAMARQAPAAMASKKTLTREEMREALIALREKIERDFPNADPARGLLRQNMLDELIRKRPSNAHEWRSKISLDLRQATDGEQFKRYAEDVFDILAGAVPAPAE